jgi:hypothetical protein
MIALASVWLALAVFLLASTMLVYRPAFTDISVVLVLWLGAPGALCLAGLVLWAHRKETSADPGLRARKLQAKIAIGLSLTAAAIVYALIIFSEKLVPIES